MNYDNFLNSLVTVTKQEEFEAMTFTLLWGDLPRRRMRRKLMSRSERTLSTLLQKCLIYSSKSFINGSTRANALPMKVQDCSQTGGPVSVRRRLHEVETVMQRITAVEEQPVLNMGFAVTLNQQTTA